MKNWNYKKLLGLFLAIFVTFFGIFYTVNAQSLGGGSGTINTLDQWTSTSSPSLSITQRTYGKAIKFTGYIAGNLCLDSNGMLYTAGCTGGGGSSFAFPFSTFPNYNATNTTIGFSAGLFSTASSTFNSTFRLPALSSGTLNVDTNGLVYSGATTTFSGGLTYSNGNVTCTGCGSSSFAFPFTSFPNYNATGTTIGFQGGLFATASSTFNSSLFLSNLSQGLAYIGTNGLVGGGVATGTVSSSGGITTTAGRSAIGGALAIGCTVADTSNTGCLTNTDWNTFNNKQATIGVTYPITLTGATVGFNGLSTSSNPTRGNLAYFSGTNTLADVATTSASCSGSVSCTAFTVIGGSPITISGAGGSSFAFPFTSFLNYNATGTPIVFNAGIVSNSSTTINDKLLLPFLPAGLTYIGSNSQLAGGVATGTVSAGSSAITVTAGRSVLNGALSVDCATASGSQTGCVTSTDYNTFNGKQNALTVSFPIQLTGSALSFTGLGTSSPAVIGNIPYFSGVNTFANVATTTVTCAGTVSCTTFNILGSSPITLTGSGSGGGSSNPFTNQFNWTFATTSSGAIGTSTISVAQSATLTLASTSAPQLSLSGGAGVGLWVFRNAGGNLYLASTTVNGLATTTATPALTILADGDVGFGTSSPWGEVAVGAPTQSNEPTLSLTTSNTGNSTPALYIDGKPNSGNADLALDRGNTSSSDSNIDFMTLGALKWQLGLQNNSTDDFELWNGTDKPAFTIKNSSNMEMGISSSSPFAKFGIHLNNGDTTPFAFSIGSSTQSATTTLFTVDNNGSVSVNDISGDFRLEATGSLGNGYFGLTNTGEGDVFIVDPTGKVGIGTSTPQGILHLESQAAGNLVFNSNAGGAGSAQAGVQFKDNSTLRWEWIKNSSNDFKVNRYNSSGALQDQPFTISGSTGLTTILNEINRSSGTTRIQGADGVDALYVATNNFTGAGTSTPQYALTSFSATAPQLSLSAGAAIPQWTFANEGGNFYLSTTSVSGLSTTTTPAFSITGATGAFGINDSTADFQFESQGKTGNGYFGITNVNDGDIFNIRGSGAAGFGTTTQWASLEVASTSPVLDLEDTNASLNNKHWFSGNFDGIFSIGTTTDVGLSNATSSAFSIQAGYGFFMASTSNNISADLTIGPVKANGSTTISVGKLQWDGYDSGGTRRCTFINSSGALSTITGACNTP